MDSATTALPNGALRGFSGLSACLGSNVGPPTVLLAHFQSCRLRQYEISKGHFMLMRTQSTRLGATLRGFEGDMPDTREGPCLGSSLIAMLFLKYIYLVFHAHILFSFCSIVVLNDFQFNSIPRVIAQNGSRSIAVRPYDPPPTTKNIHNLSNDRNNKIEMSRVKIAIGPGPTWRSSP